MSKYLQKCSKTILKINKKKLLKEVFHIEEYKVKYIQLFLYEPNLTFANTLLLLSFEKAFC